METDIAEEVIHGIGPILLEAAVLFGVVIAWIVALFFGSMATRPSFTEWKDALKERFWAFVITCSLSVITIAAIFWASFDYLSLGVVSILLIILIVSAPLYFAYLYIRMRIWIATNPNYAVLVFKNETGHMFSHTTQIRTIDGVYGQSKIMFSSMGKYLVVSGKHKFSFVVSEKQPSGRYSIPIELFDDDIEIDLKPGGLYVVEEHDASLSISVSLSCFAPNIHQTTE